MEPLLAKSPFGNSLKTLLEHTNDVLEAAWALFGKPGEPTRLASKWVWMFKLAETEAFLVNLQAAAVLHDLGKANEDFQAAVRKSGYPQLLRHEHLSGLLMVYEPMWDWLSGQEAVDWELVLSAVICHHLKADPYADEGSAHRFLGLRADRACLVVCPQHPELLHLLDRVQQVLDLPSAAPQLPGSLDLRSGEAANSFLRLKAALEEHLDDLEYELEEDPDRAKLLRAVRAGLIVADSAGSGLPRVKEPIPTWIKQVFREETLWDAAGLEEAVLRPRIERFGSKFAWSRFQDRTAELPTRALLLAPCGSGKTLAAWRWITARAQQGIRHGLFLYPTRATATEGFRDYLGFAPETAHAALLHGTAAYELEQMWSNEERERYEVDQRLFALGYWQKQLFSATVDQFLSFLQYQYGSVCLLPVLADAVVVVDEVHSFDEQMFRGLLDFLTHFQIPVLCMTATLPQDRRARLEACGLEVLDAYQEPEFQDLRQVSRAPRYCPRRIKAEEAQAQVQAALAAGKRVLWVVNQVATAQEQAQRLCASLSSEDFQTTDGVPLVCYHSRYRLCDRQKWHQAVINAFRLGGGQSKAALAITTQVCEMGLDLDADVLITEAAPVTAFIQRMGRCNRARQPRSESGDVLVYWPEDEKPYCSEDLLGIEEFLARICQSTPISQDDLEAALRAVPQPTDALRPGCQFLGSGAFASSARDQFRDIEAFTLHCSKLQRVRFEVR